jgi:hypothetical protein
MMSPATDTALADSGLENDKRGSTFLMRKKEKRSAWHAIEVSPGYQFSPRRAQL